MDPERGPRESSPDGPPDDEDGGGGGGWATPAARPGGVGAPLMPTTTLPERGVSLGEADMGPRKRPAGGAYSFLRYDRAALITLFLFRALPSAVEGRHGQRRLKGANRRKAARRGIERAAFFPAPPTLKKRRQRRKRRVL